MIKKWANQPLNPTAEGARSLWLSVGGRSGLAYR